MTLYHWIGGLGVALLVIVAVHASVFSAPPRSAPVLIDVHRGASVLEIAHLLEAEGVVRSSLGFVLYTLFQGDAYDLKPGRYEFPSIVSLNEVARKLVLGVSDEVEVRVAEGMTIHDIDALFAQQGVLEKGAFEEVTGRIPSLEGRLFPDTYRFTRGASAQSVMRVMLENFSRKAEPLLKEDSVHASDNLILASIVEREVRDKKDRRIVAGILKKRLAAGMLLQVDAVFCFIKPPPCAPITTLDLKTDSPYNTYIHKGLPPTPIGNPGSDAIEAVLHPEDSPYWFYLSDPATGKTIFGRTLDEHRANRVNYLRNR